MKITKLKFGGLTTAIALVSVLSACGNKDAKTDSSADKTASTVSADEKIVYVNSDSLLSLIHI